MRIRLKTKHGVADTIIKKRHLEDIPHDEGGMYFVDIYGCKTYFLGFQGNIEIQPKALKRNKFGGYNG